MDKLVRKIELPLLRKVLRSLHKMKHHTVSIVPKARTEPVLPLCCWKH